MNMVCHQIQKLLIEIGQIFHCYLLINLQTFIYHNKKLWWVDQQRCIIIRKVRWWLSIIQQIQKRKYYDVEISNIKKSKLSCCLNERQIVCSRGFMHFWEHLQLLSAHNFHRVLVKCLLIITQIPFVSFEWAKLCPWEILMTFNCIFFYTECEWECLYNWSYYPVCLSQERETSSNVFFLFSYDLVLRKLSGKNKPWQWWFLSFLKLVFFSTTTDLFSIFPKPLHVWLSSYTSYFGFWVFPPPLFFLLPLLFSLM
jgi:hypothetical protein